MSSRQLCGDAGGKVGGHAHASSDRRQRPAPHGHARQRHVVAAVAAIPLLVATWSGLW